MRRLHQGTVTILLHCGNTSRRAAAVYVGTLQLKSSALWTRSSSP
jgi:hypothetical protein